jgi:hypothetical protein
VTFDVAPGVKAAMGRASRSMEAPARGVAGAGRERSARAVRSTAAIAAAAVDHRPTDEEKRRARIVQGLRHLRRQHVAPRAARVAGIDVRGEACDMCDRTVVVDELEQLDVGQMIMPAHGSPRFRMVQPVERACERLRDGAE